MSRDQILTPASVLLPDPVGESFPLSGTKSPIRPHPHRWKSLSQRTSVLEPNLGFPSSTNRPGSPILTFRTRFAAGLANAPAAWISENHPGSLAGVWEAAGYAW